MQLKNIHHFGFVFVLHMGQGMTLGKLAEYTRTFWYLTKLYIRSVVGQNLVKFGPNSWMIPIWLLTDLPNLSTTSSKIAQFWQHWKSVESPWFFSLKNIWRCISTVFPHIVGAANILVWNGNTLKNSYSFRISFSPT